MKLTTRQLRKAIRRVILESVTLSEEEIVKLGTLLITLDEDNVRQAISLGEPVGLIEVVHDGLTKPSNPKFPPMYKIKIIVHDGLREYLKEEVKTNDEWPNQLHVGWMDGMSLTWFWTDPDDWGNIRQDDLLR